MLLEKDKELLKLKEEAFKIRREYNEASSKLRYGYFHEIDSKIRVIEDKKKEEFLNILNKEFREILVNFNFHYDPLNMNIGAKVKMMKIQGEYYNLGAIALNFPQEKRTSEMLKVISNDYKDASRQMESELIDLGLHPSARPCPIKNIEKFLERNRIYGFVPELY